MNIVSLFDGLSGARLALEKSGITFEKYFASEINKSAIKLSRHNFPDTIQLGCVKNVSNSQIHNIHLLIGGSPCQGFSINGNRLNFEDERSKLLFEFIRVRNELMPKYWLLENVATMSSLIKVKIDELLGVTGYCINSNIFLPQNRKRLYWTNIPYTMPLNFPINKTVEDILDKTVKSDRYWRQDKIAKQYISPTITDGVITLNPKMTSGQQTYQQDRIYDSKGRFPALTATLGDRFNIKDTAGKIRKLSIREQARLQGIPDYYMFDVVTHLEASKAIGNGFSIDVISYFINNMKR